MQPLPATLTPRIDVAREAPVVYGTRIKVSLVASEYELMGMTPDEIVAAHPHLSLADVHAALAYFYDHQEQIRDEWRTSNALIAELRDQYPNRVSAKLGR